MSNPKGKTLPNAFSIYFSMLSVYCIDVFLFKSDLTVLGDTFFSHLISVGILLLYLRAAKDPIETLGISKKTQKITAGAVFGCFFSLIPLAVVLLGEVVYRFLTDGTMLSLNFRTPNMILTGAQAISPVTCVVIYIFICFFGITFKELFFRGFLLKKFSKVTDFAKANFMQAVLYMTFVLPLLARDIPGQLSQNLITPLFAVAVVGFYVVYETLTGIKWGLITRVSGTTYIAMVDHFLCFFFTNSLFLANSQTDWNFMLHMVAVQTVSFIFVLVYYAHGMKKINEKKKRQQARKEAEIKEIEERKKARETELDVSGKLENIEEISPRNFKSFAREEAKHKHNTVHDESALEKKIEIEEALKEETPHCDDESVDDILRKMSREMKQRENPASSREITADFDSDDFLKAYQRQDGSHHNTHKHHHHHYHERKEINKKDVEKPVVSSKPQKTMAKKPKRTFAQKMQGLGGIDDSSSNGLI